jgi:hypothetical protein
MSADDLAGLETGTMHQMSAMMDKLDPDARYRVWVWLGQREGMLPMPEFARGPDPASLLPSLQQLLQGGITFPTFPAPE